MDFQSIFENSEEEFENTKSRLMAKGEINKACNRKDILETISMDRLKQETFNLAQVLQYMTSSVVVNSETMRRNCDAAVENFFIYASTFGIYIVFNFKSKISGRFKSNEIYIFIF